MRWIFALLLGAHANALAFEASLSSPSSQEICHGDLCYPSIFVPTTDFAIVHEDQSIPPGLHVRINLETGIKEARLLEPEGTDERNEINELALVPGEVVHETISKGDSRVEKPFPPTKPLAGADRSVFGKALSSLDQERSCSQHLIESLDLLEDLVHELEFGLELVKSPNAITRLLHFMQDSNADCRAKAALVLGSALRNNENAMVAMPKDFSLVTQLLSLLDRENENDTKKMLVYALSAAMALPTGQQEFAESQGHKTLLHLFSSSIDELRAKIASFVEDHFTQEPAKRIGVTVQHESGYESGLERLDELESWCNAFQASLLARSTSSLTLRAKLLSAVIQVKRVIMDTCVAGEGFLDFLAKESLRPVDESTEEIVELARSARILFGNSKASRKHGVAYI